MKSRGNTSGEGDKILTLVRCVCLSLEVYGAKITYLRAEPGSRPSKEAIADALAKTKFKMVTVTHVDTS